MLAALLKSMKQNRITRASLSFGAMQTLWLCVLSSVLWTATLWLRKYRSFSFSTALNSSRLVRPTFFKAFNEWNETIRSSIISARSKAPLSKYPNVLYVCYAIWLVPQFLVNANWFILRFHRFSEVRNFELVIVDVFYRCDWTISIAYSRLHSLWCTRRWTVEIIRFPLEAKY